MTTLGRSWLANGVAGIRILGHLLTGPLLRRRRTHWGASDSEVTAEWPDDDLVPEPAWTATHAVSISASPAQIWPWLAQLGQGRAGFYSFERLENLIGCQIRNVDRIIPEHQHIAVAEEIRLAPKMAMRVARVEPDADLVLTAGLGTTSTFAADSPGRATPRVAAAWSLYMRPIPGDGTRLIERLRYARGRSVPERIFGSRHLIEPVSFVMSKEMLLNVKALAERDALGAASGERLTAHQTSV